MSLKDRLIKNSTIDYTSTLTESKIYTKKDMSLKDRLIKNSTIDYTSTLTESKIYTKKDMIQTSVPMINVALGGSIDGGLTPGLTMLAGPSKHFKTGFSLLLASAFLKKYEDGVVLFYDSEFGTPQSYFETFGIDLDSVIHTPITDVEELKHDIMKQMKDIGRGDKVFILVDSIGNLASKKEVEDALDGKSVADMTRAKQLKSLFRMVTPHLSLKDIPMAVVNHTYKEIGMFPKDIVGGGTGSYYSADNIWILGRQQDKDGSEIAGYHFIINIEKSRYVKEKSKIPITISWEGGINKWSGLFDVALEGEYIVKPKNGWYALVDRETGEIQEPNMRAKDIVNNKELWMKMFKETDFPQYIEKKYKVGFSSIIEEDEVE
jgi:RecA/RadA recombinase